MASNGVRKLSLEDADRGKFLADTASEFNILVIGRFCVGKSELINATFLQNSEMKAKVGSGDFKPCTSVVHPYSFNVNDIKFNVYDTPGLQDDVGASNDDRSYITMMGKACRKYNLIIYCTKMDEPVRPDEITALKNLSSAVGDSVWECFMIALTFANRSYDDDSDVAHFQQKVKKKTSRLRDCFNDLNHVKDFDRFIAKRIYPVGSSKKLRLPGIEDWQVEFWQGCVDACKPGDRGKFLNFFWKLTPYAKGAIYGAVVLAGGAASIGSVGLVIAGKVLVGKAVVGVATLGAASAATAATAGYALVTGGGRKADEEETKQDDKKNK
ncbi:Translocase of chloroplast 125, chloroplastic [Geodia barretti]|uniref:Translocase of chloroplast 125, chloroplastic n=1 Tax=Geodia barretti TaxID=519541 RepID=A0AA35SDU8_GEOBA|nr:Translocase of chloroplast 125, chloroplastic [Geodia barretti]